MLDKLLTNFKRIRQKNVQVVECEIPFCDRDLYSKGFCSMHYQRNRYLSTQNIRKDNNFVEWYAYMHKWRNAQTPGPDGAPLPCNMEDCDRFVYARGLCNRCYNRERRLHK